MFGLLTLPTRALGYADPLGSIAPSRLVDHVRALSSVTDCGRIAVESLLRSRALPTAPHAKLRGRARLLQRVANDLLRAHRIVVEIEGASPDRPAILVSNHLGYLDPIVLAATVACAPIAKREVDGWPVIGDFMRALGVNFVSRGDAMSGAAALQRASRALRAGVSVLNFPEGTTTTGERVLPFRRGIFGLARRLRVPVVPVRVDFDDPETSWVGDDPFVPHYFRTAGRATTKVRVRFFPSFVPRATDAAESIADFSRRVIASRAVAAPSPRRSDLDPLFA
jgi:1-acyl-sn-glycerol-3-phosphate acyltransferase